MRLLSAFVLIAAMWQGAWGQENGITFLSGWDIHCVNVNGRDRTIEPNYDDLACWPESKRPSLEAWIDAQASGTSTLFTTKAVCVGDCPAPAPLLVPAIRKTRCTSVEIKPDKSEVCHDIAYYWDCADKTRALLTSVDGSRAACLRIEP